ncbi:hypothetical protein BU25DRAFT_408580 [Macroventuria anomochaeta]|uniref:Uncharacterized protein n=1 Tax=Macroventuria anomochaeta TaxID=301207 RepID=A0ACB6S6U8_9PLEO|nr:uncharacterized protein BU25DRAFT_408580 [Macroventuria anomochaeta]KAF2629990.1 hypothetical protein BU25DRAFT_408580 [Macroventuria anomochaeta]
MQQSSITGFFKKTPRPNASREDGNRSNNNRQERRPGPYRSRSGSSTQSTRGQHRGGKSPRNMELKKIAEETKAVLPAVLKPLPGFGADVSSIHDVNGLVPLDAKDCPRRTLPNGDKDAGRAGTRIRVLDKDSFDAAIELQPNYKAHVHLSNSSASATASSINSKPDVSSAADDEEMDLDGLPLNQPQPPVPSWDLSAKPSKQANPQLSPATSRHTSKPVAVLNLASERHAGGGWQNGAMAQEEAMCYRSSLYLSLHKSYYPLPSLSVIYTPSVLIIRSATSAGHILYTAPAPDLPVTSVISVAALRHPALTDDSKNFKNKDQRAETKRKIRISLRVAASMGHTKLVLGALGCGVFSNPPTEVAECFLEVFREKEFQGGWWEDVVFAVMDNARGGEGGKGGSGNYGQFYRVLDDQVV